VRAAEEVKGEEVGGRRRTRMETRDVESGGGGGRREED